jgi:malate dehydrogenase (oxaloacetate-decarboxylating)
MVMRLGYPDVPGFLGRVASAIGDAGGSIGSVDIVKVEQGEITRDIIFTACNEDHSKQIVERVRSLDGVVVYEAADRTFLLHEGGKLKVESKIPIRTRDDLSMAYTPGVARVCKAIQKDTDLSFSLTIRKNTIAVVSDGSAVLGLGNIGPEAAMPVMEGKCCLFKEFGGVDAIPICLNTQNVDEIVRTCLFLAPSIGGINLEDISSPRCVDIEEQLIEKLNIPVFHDDQHGTAVVVAAALQNALKIVGKKPADIRIAIAGAGAAGAAIVKLLKALGYEYILTSDRSGIIGRHRTYADNRVKRWLAENTNPENIAGTLGESLRGAHVFIGVSGPNVLTVDDVKSMAPDPLVFALSNPDPEIAPELIAPYAKIIATGRSDYPNQVNNVLCFPGLFRGMLDVRARRVTETMKVAAVHAIADSIPAADLRIDHIIPSVFDQTVGPRVAKAVAQAAIDANVAAMPQGIINY